MASVNDFASILGFSEDDLVLNREGRLSERQVNARKQIGRSSAMGCLWLVGFVFVLSLVLMISFITSSASEMHSSPLLNPSVMIPGIICLLSGGVVLLAIRSAFFPLPPTLGETTGTIVRGNVTPNKKFYEIEVNGRGFKVPKEAYDLVDPANVYTVYSADIAYDRLTIYGTDDNNHIMAMEEAKPDDAAEIRSPMEIAEEKFRRVFQFNDADLEANRAGNLSPGQINLLKNSGKDNTVLLGFLAGVAILTPLVMIGIGTQNMLLVVLGIGLVPVIWIALKSQSGGTQPDKLAKAFRSGTKTAEGITKAWVTQVQHRSSKRSWTETVYHIQIGEVKFKVKENAYYAFKDGSAYRVYYLKELQNKIVSAEQIG